MGLSSDLRIRGTAALAVALVVFATGLLANRPALSGLEADPPGADAPAYVRIARTFLGTGSLVLPGPGRIDADSQQRVGDPFGTPWALARDGRLFPKHPWLFGLLLLPGVALAGAKGALVEALLLGAALAAFLAWRVSRDLGALPAALATLAIFWAQPGGRWVAGAINVDVALAFLLVAAFAFAADGRPFAAGLLAGASILLRPTAPILFVALPWAMGERRRREMGRLAAGLVPGLLLFGIANTLMFGAPWVTAYQRAAVWTGSAMEIANVGRRFDAPLGAGLRTLLLDPAGGLVFTAPAAFLALAGFLRPEARTPERLGAALPALGAYLMLAGYSFLTQIPETSYRFAFPFLAASVAPLAALLATLGRRRRGA